MDLRSRIRNRVSPNLLKLISKSSIGRVKWRANRCKNLKEYLDLAFESSSLFPFPWIGISPSQVREEIMGLLKIVLARKPRTILEIGTARGGTLFLLSRVSSPNALIMSIDLPGGRFGSGYPEWRIPLYKSFTIMDQDIRLLRMDSHAVSTFNEVEEMLGKLKLDFLFIDGDHTYEGVKKDFEMYGKLLSDDGIIAFHDVVPGFSESVGGVPRFWSEAKRRYRWSEIVNDWNQGGLGIGILYSH